MGSFEGHVVPGTFFSLFGLWWLYSLFFRYFYVRRFRRVEYRNTTTFPCCLGKWPIETLFKLFAIAFGMTGELVTGYDTEGHFIHMGNAQHMTMFFFFGFNGLVDLCYHRKIKIPPRLDYVTAALAFLVQAFLFYNHLHGRPHMDIQVHMFLVYIILGCVFFTVLEMMYPKEMLLCLGRTFCTIFQGTWFYQIGFILYPPFGPKWDVDSHPQMMLVTLIYAWHLVALLVLVSVVGFLVWLRVTNMEGPGPAYQLVETHGEDETKVVVTNGHAKNNMHRILDSESEDA